jgi:hypothetical protein
MRKTPENRQYKYDDPRDTMITKQKERIAENLEYKIESILKHNSHLLNENASLVELLNEKNSQIEYL